MFLLVNRRVPKIHLGITVPSVPRHYSTGKVDPYTAKVDKARFDCVEQLRKVDPSTLLLSKFYPEYLRDSFIAVKSLNLELSKISFGFQPGATTKSKEFNNLKFRFWLQQLDKCRQLDLDNAATLFVDINEPCTILLADTVLKDLQFDFQLLNQMVHSHQHFYNNNSTVGFRNTDEVCSFGEGTHSQINYLMQSVLLSPQLTGFSDLGRQLLELPDSTDLRNSLTDISAHLGQATAIGAFLLGLKYFAQKKQTLMLPTDSLIKYRLSEEACLRYLQGVPSPDDHATKEQLKNVVFDIATLANDHVITARSKLSNAKLLSSTLSSTHAIHPSSSTFPDSFFLPYMSGIPTILYLERLEKYDFDILHPNLMYKEWRLAFRAWNAHRSSSF